MTQKKSRNILILSEFDNQNANVIRDYLFSFEKYSNHSCYYVYSPQYLTNSFNVSKFDVIVIFWSIYLLGHQLSDNFREKISECNALKVVFIQDEYRNIIEMQEILCSLKIDLIFTCVSDKDHEVFYPKKKIHSLKGVYSVLTGYVPEYLEKLKLPGFFDKKIDICYRSRNLPFWLGDLGQEKVVIANRFKKIAKDAGFSYDISVNENDRIYGEKWIDFLQSAKFSLGTESGASTCDFSGKIQLNIAKFLAINPDATYAEVRDKFLKNVDGKHVISTISPRVFEAIACGCVLVQHEGYYSGIIKPWIHYIPIKKDYSNIDDVITLMRNEEFCIGLINNAYNDIILSGRYNYSSFIKFFDLTISRYISEIKNVERISNCYYHLNSYLLNNQRIIIVRKSIFLLPMSPYFIPSSLGIFMFTFIFFNISFLSKKAGLIIFFKMLKLEISLYDYFNLIREYRYIFALINKSKKNGECTERKLFYSNFDQKADGALCLRMSPESHSMTRIDNDMKWIDKIICDIISGKIKRFFFFSEFRNAFMEVHFLNNKIRIPIEIPNPFRFQQFEKIFGEKSSDI